MAVENVATANLTHPHHHHHHDFGMEDSIDGVPSSQTTASKCCDDDGRRPKRKGTIWTASSHIITAVIGSGVLSLAWAIAQLGWILGPAVMIFFSVVTLYTSSFLADSYRTGNPNSGNRNYTYIDAVASILGGINVPLCGIIQYVNLYGTAIGYTIGGAISMMAIKRSNCFHSSGGKNPCHVPSNPFILGFGATQIFISQIPDFDQTWWLSILAAVMSFIYSIIGVALAIAKVAARGSFKGTITGVNIGTATEPQKYWATFQALGNIAFAYSVSQILIEIQDTIKSPPSEIKTMKKSIKLSIAVTTAFYMICGCMGYAAFGDSSPGNLLTGFGFYNPYWLVDIANAAIVIHLLGAYQVYSQPIFALVEKWAAQRWPKLVGSEFKIPTFGFSPYNLNIFRLVWRTVFVVSTTVISMLVPFFNDILGVLGAIGFWPLTVYFPVEMYILEKKIAKWSGKWNCLQILSVVCLVVSVVACIGSVAGVLIDLKTYKPFSFNY